ncbi:MAG: hypothetical protein SWQ30_02520 [Thermodesulfobacteriota bacterium]|nr:hypothetical protein [Thermodesulfobacteriota bacterium]
MIRVHVLNVGHGDCIVVEFPSGRLTVVDINRGEKMDADSLAEIIQTWNPSGAANDRFLYQTGGLDYRTLLQRAGYDIELTDPLRHIKALIQSSGNADGVFRFISTHPHMDHLTGLSDLMHYVGMINAWVLPNSHTQDLSKLSESQKEDWALYKSFRDDAQNTVKVVRPFAHDTGDFWTQDGIKILGPNPALLKAADDSGDANGMSYVLLIKHGWSKVVLGGDAEKATWDYIVESHGADIADIQLLKASHHGRDSGYHQPAVKLMNPKYTAVSVGKKPDSDASNKYRQYSDLVVSTRWHGTMVFDLYENGTILFRPENDRCSNSFSMATLGRAASL